jgi:hypothetical protein
VHAKDAVAAVIAAADGDDAWIEVGYEGEEGS